jgi:hypothetical protein
LNIYIQKKVRADLLGRQHPLTFFLNIYIQKKVRAHPGRDIFFFRRYFIAVWTPSLPRKFAGERAYKKTRRGGDGPFKGPDLPCGVPLVSFLVSFFSMKKNKQTEKETNRNLKGFP